MSGEAETLASTGFAHGRRSAVSRADLARLISALPTEQIPTAATFCGFVAVDEPSTAVMNAVVEALPASESPLPPPVMAVGPMPLYRFEKMVFTEDANDDLTTAPPVKPGLSKQELHGGNRSLFATPARSSLTPWSRLWPVLRAALQGTQRGRDIDVSECMQRWGRGQIMNDLPRVQRKVWADRVELWIDRSLRLAPFWSDQDEVCLRLLRCCGKSGLRLRILDSQEQSTSIPTRGDLLSGQRVDAAQRVLVLSDLGAYASPVEQRAWRLTAQRLRRMDVHVAALVPVPPDRVSKALAREWSAASWERGSSSVQSQGVRSRESVSQRAERLLRLCSPASYVQLGLLRALRRLLPASETDAATEVDVFTHSKVCSADAVGLVLSPEPTALLRQQFFESEPTSLQAKVSETIRQWHQGLPQELLRMETLSWLAMGSTAPPPGQVSDALAFAERLGSSLREGLSDPQVTSLVKRCARMMLNALPDPAYQALPALQPIFAGAYAGVSGIRVPEGLSPKLLYSELVWAPEIVWWSVRQIGSALVLRQEANSTWPAHSTGSGSPVAWLQARGSHILVKWSQEGVARQQILKDGLRLPLRLHETVEIRSDCCTITIAPWTCEPWATTAGRDRYGLWTEAEVKDVLLRFRWIPPGRFLMGSPESEAGRYDNEGPQHEVTWTQGRWLADAPCTQALWQAVMGANPSYFVSLDRPVEQVSWYDCQEFLRRLNELLPGLHARLPSEAEWEHACRAGTQTATWLGDLEILGENNAPLLDGIAWYGGNCGVDFELEKGYDTRGWLKKQHEHNMGGTHPIRQKQANPLGLFDVLGNVHQWCMDQISNYETKAVENPVVPDADGGSRRMLRGGAWGDFARCVRAAYRFGLDPGRRSRNLGFRVARGQESGLEGRAEPALRSGSLSHDAGRGIAAAASRDVTQLSSSEINILPSNRDK